VVSVNTFWVALGFAGQVAFSSRFLVQWLASERSRRSVVPVAFWWLSILGAAFLLAYSIYRVDPVFILGQSFGFIVYARNLILLHREREQKENDQRHSHGPSDSNSATG